MGKPTLVLSSELIRAARALLRWDQRDLANASSVSLPTVKRLESRPGAMAAHMSTVTLLRKALEAAGIEFIDENGGGPGVRLRKRQQKKAESAGQR
jgi:transcriptional regulator with XRE-family HTH domain